MTTLPPPHPRQLGPADLAVDLAAAARIVPPLWPLDGAIAVNPLAGLEDLPFTAAVARGAALFGARRTLPLDQWRALVAAGRIEPGAVRDTAIERLGGWPAAFTPAAPRVAQLDLLMARLFDLPASAPVTAATADAPALLVATWCAAFFDEGIGAAAMPGRAAGLYPAVLALLPHDPAFRRLADGRALALRGRPTDPLLALAASLDRIGVTGAARPAALEALVARLPGWAGHLRWRAEHAEPEVAARAPAGMADLLALLMLADEAAGQQDRAVALPAPVDVGATEAALRTRFGLSAEAPGLRAIAALDEAELGFLFQRAAERGYRDALVRQLPARPPAPSAERPAAQLVFCIDVRSEPFRRALEAEGAYETFGYAGFFGLPVAVHAPHRPRSRRLPVLIQPQHDVQLAPVAGQEGRLAAERGGAATRDLLALAKGGAATGFATAEATGPLAAIAMLANGFAPRLVERWRARARPDCRPCLDAASGLSDAERVAYARALFALTGMARATAPLVVLVGHRGQAVNNPYAAALDCGACGGHGGADNARMLAAILNDPAVRAALAADGEAIPADTLFVAGEHCTTDDTVALFDLDQAPASHRAGLDALAAALARAGAANRARRAATLGRVPADLGRGSLHWGEVRPEWGLAGAAAFIVGPRAWTARVDLGGRAFLHSYDWRADPEGEALETILTAPMVVAQWISCQYLFSTIDPDRYGAGDKIVHNPIGRIGVVRGDGGDLCVGLPRQSLIDDHGLPAHVPQRLLTVVHAPMQRVTAVVERHAILRRLFGNGWVQLIVIDPATGRARRWREAEERPAAVTLSHPAPAEADTEELFA